jgi:hypothetical protein
MFFLAVRQSGWDVSRHIDTVWASNGGDGHRRIFDLRSSSLHGHADMVAPGRLAWARQTIHELCSDNTRTIGQVRSVVVEACKRLA